MGLSYFGLFIGGSAAVCVFCPLFQFWVCGFVCLILVLGHLGLVFLERMDGLFLFLVSRCTSFPFTWKFSLPIFLYFSNFCILCPFIVCSCLGMVFFCYFLWWFFERFICGVYVAWFECQQEPLTLVFLLTLCIWMPSMAFYQCCFSLKS